MGLYDRDYATRRHRYSGSPRTLGEFFGQYSVVTILVVINVAVYAADAISSYRLSEYTALHLESAYRPWMWWQFLTYGFTHVPSPSHIFMNMLLLWFFGRDIEYLLGRWELLRLYLFTIVIGGVVWVILNHFRGVTSGVLLGASGGCVGIFLLFCLNYPRRTVFLIVFPVPAWVAGILLIAPDVLGALQNQESQIAYSVHLTGAAVALLYYYQSWNFGQIWDRLGGSAVWTRLKFLTQRRPRLRVRRPDDELQDAEFKNTAEDIRAEKEWERLEAELEAILDKINQHGTESLTRAERRTLERASRMYRERRRAKDQD